MLTCLLTFYYVIPDHDQVGRDYAVEVCNSLLDVANEVKLLDLSKVWPEIPEHGDVTDMMAELGPEDGCILREHPKFCVNP